MELRVCTALSLLLPILGGCFAPLKNLVDASAMEQQMRSAAITRCVDQLDVRGIDPGKRYALQVAAPSGVDTALIRARLAQRLADAEIRLQPETSSRKTLASSPTLLAVMPVAGVDTEATLIGIPFVVPGLPVALGDISVYKSSTLTGRARLELSAWTPDRREIAVVPTTHASRYFRNVTVLMFFGPFRFTDLEEPLPGEEP